MSKSILLTTATTLIQQKRLLLSNEHRKIDLSDILGRAKVLHEPPSLMSFTASPYPAFYCQERLSEDRQIIPLLKPLTRCKICDVALVEDEKSYKQFLRRVKLPAADYYSGGGGGLIGAEGYFRHKHVVEMNEFACKTLRYGDRDIRGEAS